MCSITVLYIISCLSLSCPPDGQTFISTSRDCVFAILIYLFSNSTCFDTPFEIQTYISKGYRNTNGISKGVSKYKCAQIARKKNQPKSNLAIYFGVIYNFIFKLIYSLDLRGGSQSRVGHIRLAKSSRFFTPFYPT